MMATLPLIILLVLFVIGFPIGFALMLCVVPYQDALCEAVGHGVTAYASKLLESAAMRGVAAWSVHCQKNK